MDSLIIAVVYGARRALSPARRALDFACVGELLGVGTFWGGVARAEQDVAVPAQHCELLLATAVEGKVAALEIVLHKFSE